MEFRVLGLDPATGRVHDVLDQKIGSMPSFEVSASCLVTKTLQRQVILTSTNTSAKCQKCLPGIPPKNFIQTCKMTFCRTHLEDILSSWHALTC